MMGSSSTSSINKYRGALVQEAKISGSIRNFMAARMIATAMWVMRIYILFLSVQYIFFASGFDMDHFYHRVLLANGFVCSLRLHQRVPSFKISRQNLAVMMEEDSAQYLLYSITFLTCTPI